METWSLRGPETAVGACGLSPVTVPVLETGSSSCSETGRRTRPVPTSHGGCLSVDGDEEGLYATLKKRANVREQVRWVGRDPGWWDRLDILGVPQVVVVRPDGQIQTHQAPLPSEGLFTAMRRWQKLSGSRRP